MPAFRRTIVALGFSDLAYDRGKSGLPVLAVGVVGAIVGQRRLPVAKRPRWLVLGISLALPFYVVADWWRDLSSLSR